MIWVSRTIKKLIDHLFFYPDVFFAEWLHILLKLNFRLLIRPIKGFHFLFEFGNKLLQLWFFIVVDWRVKIFLVFTSFTKVIAMLQDVVFGAFLLTLRILNSETLRLVSISLWRWLAWIYWAIPLEFSTVYL